MPCRAQLPARLIRPRRGSIRHARSPCTRPTFAAALLSPQVGPPGLLCVALGGGEKQPPLGLCVGLGLLAREGVCVCGRAGSIKGGLRVHGCVVVVGGGGRGRHCGTFAMMHTAGSSCMQLPWPPTTPLAHPHAHALHHALHHTTHFIGHGFAPAPARPIILCLLSSEKMRQRCVYRVPCPPAPHPRPPPPPPRPPPPPPNGASRSVQDLDVCPALVGGASGVHRPDRPAGDDLHSRPTRHKRPSVRCQGTCATVQRGAAETCIMHARTTSNGIPASPALRHQPTADPKGPDKRLQITRLELHAVEPHGVVSTS